MVLAELRELAGQLGITGTAGLRKGDLIAAIKEKQGSGAPAKAEKPAKAAKAPAAEKPAAKAPEKVVEKIVEKPVQQQLEVAEKPAAAESGAADDTGRS